MDRARAILQEVWGHGQFRPLQEEIISSVSSGKDTLALLPTGGGKSICFQVPGLLMNGLTIVISPLIALMKDQVHHLVERGVPATAVNSSLGAQEIDERLQGVMDGKYKFLYLAPERIATDIFLDRLPEFNLKLLAVDEAHCISQWGYDFRPAYFEINRIREILPNVPIIALTATATEAVKKDICEQLHLREPAIFSKSFRRDNLSYQVAETDDVPGRIFAELRKAQGSAIVYARTRKATVTFAEWLNQQGIKAEAYHGGLDNTKRSEVQQQWIENAVPVIVATNAFGMGIDKPDVRLVAHYQLPDDIESYYQEAGRAGRDGQPATAIAVVNNRERKELARWVEQSYPTWEMLVAHYQVLCNFYRITHEANPEITFPLDIVEICNRFTLSPIDFFASLRILDREGLILLNDRPDVYGWIQLAVKPQQILEFKEQVPEQAGLVDFMLRNLGGDAFWEETRFLPYHWSRKLSLEPSELNRKLQALHDRGMIYYRAPMDLPSIKFLQPRIELSKRAMNWDKYEFLRQRKQERFEAMLSYSGQEGGCRSRRLESYFGEKNPQDCGHCDICQSRGATHSQSLYEAIRNEAKSLLASNSLPFDQIVLGISSGPEKLRREVLRDLVDRKIIVMGRDFKFSWAGN